MITNVAMRIDIIYISRLPENLFLFKIDAREYFQALYLELAVSVQNRTREEPGFQA
jgi:hypothetical protein